MILYSVYVCTGHGILVKIIGHFHSESNQKVIFLSSSTTLKEVTIYRYVHMHKGNLKYSLFLNYMISRDAAAFVIYCMQ